MADITYPLFPIFAFLGCILPLIPLPWHLQALNSGTCFFIFWSSLACLNQFVNSVVWHNNALNPSPVWCDISIRIMMGASVGIPAASLCIHRRLYQIACIRTAPISYAEKRRGIIIDAIICVLVPIIYIALQYIVQGHRFNILEDIGCYPAIYNTIPAFFISSIWPVVFGLISSVYCFLSLRAFAKRRLEFSQFLSSNSALTVGRYFRLMGLALAEICTTTPLAIFMIWLNAAATPVGPWRSWDDTHFAYSRMEQIVASTWRSNHLLVIAIELSRWVNPMCSFTFFAFFGFAQESRKNYRLAWNWIRKSVGFPVAAASSKNASSCQCLPSLPPYRLSTQCMT
ncbi:fungal pheromone STE3G-protein-coupled receptor [Agrocybe pediades]|nr:fungal pheromone STE3G-protein-coupled receptor [Agrocybe pediades]